MDGEGSDGDGGIDCGEPLLGLPDMGLGIPCRWAEGSVTTQPARTRLKATATTVHAGGLIERCRCVDER